MLFILFILTLTLSSFAGTNIKHLELDHSDTCILFNDGKMKCWGTGFNHLGNGGIIHTNPYEFKAP